MDKKILAVSLCLSLAGLMGYAHAGPEVYTEGPFVVRKVEGGCKLETNLSTKHQKPAPKDGVDEPMGILALFSSDKFYSELFTNRKKVGQAQKAVKVAFDGGKGVDYAFTATPGSDAYWRWQYLDHTKGLLEGIGSKKTMSLEFSNGKNTFHFEVPLTHGKQALLEVKKCSGEKVETPVAKKPEPAKSPVKAATKEETKKSTEKTTTKEPPAKNTSKEPPAKNTSKEPPLKNTSKEPAAKKTSSEPAAKTATKPSQATATKETPKKEGNKKDVAPKKE